MRSYPLVLCLLVAAACGTKDVGELCEKDRECDAICAFLGYPSASRRVCTASCSDGADCPGESTCLGGLCVAACAQDADCPDGSICDGSTCAVACRDDGDCTMGACVSPGGLCQ